MMLPNDNLSLCRPEGLYARTPLVGRGPFRDDFN